MTSDSHAEALRAAQSRTFGAGALAGTDVLAARDAAHYAASLTKPDEALQQFCAAEVRGDVSLAVAIAARAWEMRGAPGGAWQPVLDAFAASSPERNASLYKLADLSGDFLSPAEKAWNRLRRDMPGSAEAAEDSAGAA